MYILNNNINFFIANIFLLRHIFLNKNKNKIFKYKYMLKKRIYRLNYIFSNKLQEYLNTRQ